MCSIPNNCREFRRDLLNVKVFPTTREMGRAAAEAVAAKIAELLGEQEEVNMIFAAASSQEAFLESLIADRRIDWSRINAFHMDEYIGLDATAPQSFARFLRERIFDRVPFRSVHCLNGKAADQEAECTRYAAPAGALSDRHCLHGHRRERTYRLQRPRCGGFQRPEAGQGRGARSRLPPAAGQ